MVCFPLLKGIADPVVVLGVVKDRSILLCSDFLRVARSWADRNTEGTMAYNG